MLAEINGVMDPATGPSTEKRCPGPKVRLSVTDPLILRPISVDIRFWITQTFAAPTEPNGIGNTVIAAVAGGISILPTLCAFSVPLVDRVELPEFTAALGGVH